MTNITRRIGHAAAVSALAAAGVVGFSGSATAGTNGQQLVFHDGLGSVYSIKVWGSNQNGQYVEHCFNTPATDTYLAGWWWKGYVGLEGFSGTGCGGQQIVVRPSLGPVPEQQAGDWFTIGV
ncbi:hypothetical protein ACPB9E_35740 [Streptomyces exfoliatus]|uniref:hypothetical protein n=1 Tax=Streptomyces exfoliatus TaxID=1905 RepID=UPI003C2EF1AF